MRHPFENRIIASIAICLFTAIVLGSTTGCIAVPKTDITFNPNTHKLRITSPKNVAIGGVTIVQSSNSFSMTVTNYSSTNDSTIVSTVTTAQAAVANNALADIKALADLAKAAAK